MVRLPNDPTRHEYRSPIFRRRARAALPTFLLLAAAALADHGPGTTGGGLNVVSGETLKQGKLSFDLRYDYTSFEPLTTSEIAAKAKKGGEFDFLDSSLLGAVTASYGLSDDVQVNFTIGSYRARGAGSAEFDSTTGNVDFATFDPDGLTDSWLTGKWRCLRGPFGSFALYGGEKFPTGKWDVKNSAGEQVELSSTAGSGSFDSMLGVGYSIWLTERVTLDASTQYTLRTEAHDFKVGDRIDTGAAVAYRLTDDPKEFPRTSVFGELNGRRLFQSESNGQRDPNSGGYSIFVSAGVKVGLTDNVAWTIALQVPVWQDLNGEQQTTQFKATTGITFSF